MSEQIEGAPPCPGCGRSEPVVTRAFVNIYKDLEYSGRWIISNEDWDTFEAAYKNRDQLDNYIETVEIVRNGA